MPVDFFSLVVEPSHDSLHLGGYEVVHVNLQSVDIISIIGPIKFIIVFIVCFTKFYLLGSSDCRRFISCALAIICLLFLSMSL